jgi:hypothetical protein
MPTVKIVPFPGSPGPRGLQGPAGPQGPQGAQGPQGVAGTPATFPNAVSWTPELSGVGFAQSSNPATGTYIKMNDLVHINMNIPLTNVTNFGTDQYYVLLPFASSVHSDVWGGTIHDTNVGDFYSIKGHIDQGSRLLSLWYVSSIAKDEPMDYNSPFPLDNTDLFHMSFMYTTSE